MRRAALAALLAGALLLPVAAFAVQGPHPDIVKSFSTAVERGLIAGDPAYYYNDEASKLEYAHAIMTATVELDRRLEASMRTWEAPDVGPQWCDEGDSYWNHGPRQGEFVPQQIAYPFGATYWRIVIWGDGFRPVVFDDRDGFPPVGLSHPYSDDLYVIACSYVKGGSPSTTTTTNPTIPPSSTTTTSSVPGPTTTSTSTVPTTTTTTPPAPTTTTTTVPPAGVPVAPGTGTIQTAVDAYPDGTTFVLSGIYTDSVVPDRGDTFRCLEATLDGSGRAHAFTGSADDVTIDGCEITGYSPPSQRGAIEGGGDRWTVVDSDVHNNATVGIRLVGDGGRIENTRIAYNHQLGIAAGPGADIVIRGNEIAYNNWLNEFSWGHEAGGTKFWSTTDLLVEGNWSHHNHGPGLWTDHDNLRTVYRDNVVEDNADAPGIFHEISYEALIEGNTIRRNGHPAETPRPWKKGAGIHISASENVTVRGNTLEGNVDGIAGDQQARGSGVHGPYLIRNLLVEGNTVIDSGYSGLVRDTGDNAIFDSRNNWWRGNDYVQSDGFFWNNGVRSWTYWQSAGQDVGGSYG